MDLRPMVRCGILSALSLVLMAADFPIPFLFPEYLKYDFSELPALLAAVGMGPGWGLVVEVVKNLLYLALGLSSAGWIGVLANLLAGSTLVLVTGWTASRLGLARWDAGEPSPLAVWWHRGSLAVAAGTLAMAAVMFVANGALLLRLWGIPADQTWHVALATIVPFNLFKGIVSGTLGLALCRRVVPAVFRVLEQRAA
ncbi:MAG: ECF transporter S component [Bacillota bacterium]